MFIMKKQYIVLVIIFNLQKGTLNIAKVTKPEDYIAGICISNYELMSGNQVRILCPKEEK